MKILLICSLLSSGLVLAQDFQPSQQARYRVIFEADWSAATHPADFPPGPHFSGLIGASHDSNTVIWREGGLASDGIEVMAEAGGKNTLINEINTLIGSGGAANILSGDGVTTSPGVVTLQQFVPVENQSCN